MTCSVNLIVLCTNGGYKIYPSNTAHTARALLDSGRLVESKGGVIL